MNNNCFIEHATQYLNSHYENSFEIDNLMNIYIFSLRLSSFIELVNFWSQILGYVIFACDNHKIRKNIIINLMEENCGNLTHVETFYEFLLECGYDKPIHDIKSNHVISKYKNLLEEYMKKYNFSQCCAILGSIEYVYHIMAKKINKYFIHKKGYQPHNHYTIHELLDMKHATDLFECSDNDSLTEKFLDIGAKWIINCFNELLEFKPVFGFTYEDSQIELNAISFSKKHICDGLMILSGGDTLFDIADKINNLTAVDMNLAQIKLVTEKISHLKSNTYENFLIEQEQKQIVYDNLFYKLKSGESFENVFNNENLKQKFGEQAVANTTKNFAQHFLDVSNNKGMYYNWIFDRNLQLKIDKIKNFNIHAIENVKLEHGMFEHKLTVDSYDFIQTSNITDWMQNHEFIDFCKKIKLSLRIGGVLIMRRLASDNILSPHFPGCINIADKTDLYLETIIWIKQ